MSNHLIRKKLSRDAKDYLRTFIVTLIVVLFFCLCNVLYMLHNVYNYKDNQSQNVDAAFESYLVDILIDKNKKHALAEPKNYYINMRLGVLYGYKKDYINAEKELKNAIEKAPRNNLLPTLRLAKLYVYENKLKEAQDLIDNRPDTQNKNLLSLKGDIYMLLGDAYVKQGYLLVAISKYERAELYYSAIKAPQLKDLSKKYINACINLADNYVSSNKVDEALQALKKAYNKNPKDVELNYKLGLIYSDNDIYKAYDYLTYVSKQKPQILNFDAYYELINKISEDKINKGEITNGQMYKQKAEQYKKFVQNNLLYKKDLFFDKIKSDVKYDLAAKSYLINLQFKLQNNSGLDINNLSVISVFQDNDTEISTQNQKIATENNVFKAGITTPIITTGAIEKYKNSESNNIKITVYAYKTPKYVIKLYEETIPKPPID